MTAAHTPTDPLASPNLTWPRAGVSAAIFREDHVLIIQRGKGPLQGLWSLPGGHLQAGETARAGAAREVHEETGVVAEIMALNEVIDVIRHDDHGAVAVHYMIASFVGRYVEGTVAAASDAADARFVTLDALNGFAMTPRAGQIIAQALALLQRHV